MHRRTSLVGTMRLPHSQLWARITCLPFVLQYYMAVCCSFCLPTFILTTSFSSERSSGPPAADEQAFLKIVTSSHSSIQARTPYSQLRSLESCSHRRKVSLVVRYGLMHYSLRPVILDRDDDRRRPGHSQPTGVPTVHASQISRYRLSRGQAEPLNMEVLFNLQAEYTRPKVLIRLVT